jgi:hypothetical protein
VLAEWPVKLLLTHSDDWWLVATVVISRRCSLFLWSLFPENGSDSIVLPAPEHSSSPAIRHSSSLSWQANFEDFIPFLHRCC